MPLPELSPKEWAAIAKRLTEFAFKWTRKRSMSDAEDLAQQAISQLYDGEHAPWDETKDPELFDHLAKAVCNLVSNRRRAASNRNKRLKTKHWESIEAPTRSPEAEVADREMASLLLSHAETDLAGDPQGLKLSGCFRAGVDVAGDQAVHAELHIEDVRRARRRFFDAVERARAALEGAPSKEGDE